MQLLSFGHRELRTFDGMKTVEKGRTRIINVEKSLQHFSTFMKVNYYSLHIGIR
jgi:hypothetical protein